jgi:pyridoxamine 5'-phosphate oxidase
MNSEYSSDPLDQFRAWFAEAGTEVVALATATADGAPSARMVLLKGADERGFTFFTNYESRKGRELAENPRAALLFHWPGRQVRIEGVVERISAEESDAYWATRPRGAQLAAIASDQSRPIDSRQDLEARFAAADTGFSGEIARPEKWGGFRLSPTRYEFWEHRDNRLHDRESYLWDEGEWLRSRLMP